MGVSSWVPDGIKERYFNLVGFNQFGLLHDDCLHETEVVQEAIARLPPELQDERSFRIQRALHCCLLHTVLPKDQWTTWEEHKTKGEYLRPYIDEVKKEIDERDAWEKM